MASYSLYSARLSRPHGMHPMFDLGLATQTAAPSYASSQAEISTCQPTPRQDISLSVSRHVTSTSVRMDTG